MATDESPDTTADTPSVEAQAQEQTGQQQVRLRIEQRNMATAYANAFRTGSTAEEVMLDFGLNQVVQTRSPDSARDEGDAGTQPVGEILFDVNNRIILNFYTAKRLAITLGQLIRRFEDQFGELKLNVSERGTNQSSNPT